MLQRVVYCCDFFHIQLSFDGYFGSKKCRCVCVYMLHLLVFPEPLVWYNWRSSKASFLAKSGVGDSSQGYRVFTLAKNPVC